MSGAHLRHTLFVTVLVLLAGCAGFGGGSTTTDEGIGPGPVSPEDVTPIAPGIGEDAGLVNSTALLTSHRNTLVESGFRYRYNNTKIQRITEPGEPTRRSVTVAVTGRVAAESGLSPYFVTETDRSGERPTTTARYVDADGGAKRVHTGDNVTVTPYDENATALLTTHYLMRNFLVEGNWAVVNVTADRTVLAVGPAWADWRNESAGNRNISTRTYHEGRLVVTDGRIRRLSMNQTSISRVTENGTLLTSEATIQRFEYVLLEFNGTTVELPSWVSTANATTDANRIGRPTA